MENVDNYENRYIMQKNYNCCEYAILLENA